MDGLEAHLSTECAAARWTAEITRQLRRGSQLRKGGVDAGPARPGGAALSLCACPLIVD